MVTTSTTHPTVHYLHPLCQGPLHAVHDLTSACCIHIHLCISHQTHHPSPAGHPSLLSCRSLHPDSTPSLLSDDVRPRFSLSRTIFLVATFPPNLSLCLFWNHRFVLDCKQPVSQSPSTHGLPCTLNHPLYSFLYTLGLKPLYLLVQAYIY
ncbi:hypothetical protein FA13DRAFT_110071 [Coprinellus micaceus]|uniref:Uncharacterized protein n=1 Tax=Coprinellus micaceus TaxID=71717 RepID=A0A4Y7THV6_COPMI|nr:hypothetical protein FA13DRAFT_110071 [Coprinellus micaceus]